MVHKCDFSSKNSFHTCIFRFPSHSLPCHKHAWNVWNFHRPLLFLSLFRIYGESIRGAPPSVPIPETYVTFSQSFARTDFANSSVDSYIYRITSKRIIKSKRNYRAIKCNNNQVVQTVVHFMSPQDLVLIRSRRGPIWMNIQHYDRDERPNTWYAAWRC